MHRSIFNTLTSVVLLAATCTAHAGNWNESWESGKQAAIQRCTNMFDDYQLQAVCMENEKDGYDKMQGDFGLPSTASESAKMRCSRVFDDFQLQAVCMQNEKEGNDKMNNY